MFRKNKESGSLKAITYNEIKGNKGVTLIELLVSIAILAVVAGPFFSMFLSATHNNVQSDDRMRAAVIAQSKMEELKNDYLYQLSKAPFGDTVTTDSADGFTVSTVVYKIENGTLEDNSTEFSNIAIPKTPFLVIDEQNLNGKSDLSQNEYTLTITKDIVGNVECQINDSKGDSVGSTTLTPVNSSAGSGTEVGIAAKITSTSGSAAKIYVNIASFTDPRVVFYVLDDTYSSKLKLYNVSDSNTPFYEYDHLTENNIDNDYVNVLYQIKVDVIKNNITMAELVSYVKK